MYTLFIDNAPKNPEYNDPVIDLLENSFKHVVRRVGYRRASMSKKLRENAESIIISGVPWSYSDKTAAKRAPYYKWLVEPERDDSKQPVIGICLGHQILSLLHGGDLTTGSANEKGMVELKPVAHDELFADIGIDDSTGLPKPITVESDHWCWATVPPNFTPLATNEAVSVLGQPSNHIMRHIDRPIYGFQAHVERTEFGRQMLAGIVQTAKENALSQLEQAQKNDEFSIPAFLTPTLQN